MPATAARFARRLLELDPGLEVVLQVSLWVVIKIFVVSDDM